MASSGSIAEARCRRVGGGAHSSATAVTLDRRQWLGSVAASAGVLVSCARQRGGVGPIAPGAGDVDPPALLRLAHEQLSAVGSVHAVAMEVARSVVTDTSGRRAVHLHREAWVRITLADRDGKTRHLTVAGFGAEAVTSAVGRLARRVISASANLPLRPPGDRSKEYPSDLWRAQVEELARRAERERSSRIVDRSILLESERTTAWSLTSRGAAQNQVERSRVAVGYVAWSGSLPSHGTAETLVVGGPSDATVSDDALGRAAASALELVTPGQPSPEPRPIVLSPPAMAIVARAWDHARKRWPDAATGDVSLSLTDAENARAVGGGGLATGDTALAMKMGCASLGHLRLVPTSVAAESLAASAPAWRIERLTAGSLDPTKGRFVAVADRVREVVDADPTGRVFADVVLEISLRDALRPQSVGREPAIVAGRDPSGWWSVETPAATVLGSVRARRA